MFVNGVQFSGDSFPANKVTVLNKTGGTMVAGGVYALDFAWQRDRPAADDVLRRRDGRGQPSGILIVPEKDIAARDTGIVVIQGPTVAIVDGSGVAVAAGDPLKAAAASNKLVKATIGTDRVCRYAFERAHGANVKASIFFRGFFPHI